MDNKKGKAESNVTEKEKKAEKYFYAVGKRKSAIARVRIYPSKKADGITVNDRKLAEYFSISRLQEVARAALVVSGQEETFGAVVKVTGGGINAQAEAIRLGVARALVKFDETLKKVLKSHGYLTRDSRIVERKKPGLKKARKSPQWAKR